MKNHEYLMDLWLCEHCGKEYAVEPGEPIYGFDCPHCGGMSDYDEEYEREIDETLGPDGWGTA